VTPIYYVCFTTCVILASAILFREFDHLSGHNWIGLLCGLAIVFTAIILLHLCKKSEISLKFPESLAKQESEVENEPTGENVDIKDTNNRNSGNFLLQETEKSHNSYGTRI